MQIEMLRTVSFLQELTDEELLGFSSLLTVSETKPGDRIISEGTEIDSFFIVGKGTMHVRRQAQKRQVLLGRIGPGGFFGEVNLFESGNATASVYSMDEATLASVDYPTLRAFMKNHPAAGYKIVSSLMAELARRLRQTNDRLVNTVFWSQRGPGV